MNLGAHITAKESPTLRERRRLRYKAWYAKNKSYFSNRLKDPKKRLAARMRTRVFNAIKRLDNRGLKSAPTAVLIGCSIEKLREHLESQFRDGMTWDNYGPVWHVDHIKPCAAFDLSRPDEQAKCFHYKNMQPLFAKENLKKNRKYENQATEHDQGTPQEVVWESIPLLVTAGQEKEKRPFIFTKQEKLSATRKIAAFRIYRKNERTGGNASQRVDCQMNDSMNFDDPSADSQDRMSGRLDSQKQEALEAKAVRTFIIQHPGCNEKAIREGTGIAKPFRAIKWLLKRGLIANSFNGYEVKPL